MRPATLWKDFISLVFPESCHGCHGELLSGETLICTHCRTSFPKTGHMTEKENELWLKFRNRVNFEYAIAHYKFYKKGSIQSLLHEIKYKNNQELGIYLGCLFGYELKAHGFQNKFDLLIPVPLHDSKLKKRGYNQSELLARGLAEVLNITVGNALTIRNKATQTQTKVNKTERWTNVADRFEVLNPELIEGKHIAILDDVITTGATVDALAEVIARCNPSKISLLALAEAQRY